MTGMHGTDPRYKNGSANASHAPVVTALTSLATQTGREQSVYTRRQLIS